MVSRMVSATRPVPRKAPVPPRRASKPRQPAAHPARLRLAGLLSAVALALASLTLILARSGVDDLPAGPGTRLPSAAPFYDGRVYESENVRIKFTPPPPAPTEEEAEPEPEEEPR